MHSRNCPGARDYDDRCEPGMAEHDASCSPSRIEQRAQHGDIFVYEHLCMQISAAMSFQEERYRTLACNLNISLDDLGGMNDIPALCDDAFGCTSALHSQACPKEKSCPKPERLVHPRSGRLSPKTLQMVLSTSNVSHSSDASSGADTSYDSGLYRWLELTGSSVFESQPRRSSKGPSGQPSNLSPNTSVVSSRSAYSQPSPLSSAPRQKIALPSPPPTIRLPSIEIFPENSLEFRNGGSRESNERASRSALLLDSSSEDVPPEWLMDLQRPSIEPRDVDALHRDYQQVIDELRDTYSPNDNHNNTPKWTRYPFARHSKESDLHGLDDLPPQCTSKSTNPSDSPEMTQTRSTQGLHTELSSMIFEQVAQDEAMVVKLRQMADRLDRLAQHKRKIAVVAGLRGRGGEGWNVK